MVPFAKLMTEKFEVPCKMTNDANAAALGEMMFGAARGMKDFIMMTLGTGVGSGIISNGKLIYGHDGFAGELGHTIVKPGGRKHWSTGSEVLWRLMHLPQELQLPPKKCGQNFQTLC